jgi:hypothetical protein
VGVAGATTGVGVGAERVAVGSGRGVNVGGAVGDDSAVGGSAAPAVAVGAGRGATVGSSAVTPPPCKAAVGCVSAVDLGPAAGVEDRPHPANTITNIAISQDNRLIPIVSIHSAIDD